MLVEGCVVNITGRQAISPSHKRTTNRAKATVEINDPIDDMKCHVA